MPAHHYSAPMNFRKDLPAWCSAHWVSVTALSAFTGLCLLLMLLTSLGLVQWSPSPPCTVLVGNEASEVTAAKSTNTDLSKLHNASVRAKNGQGIGIIQGQGQGGGGISTATVTTATSNSGTAQGLQSTSASAEATSSAAAATATSSSQSSLAPSTSLSSSLANANNGGNYAQVLIIFK